jgi:hypothetical protein
MDGTRDFGKNEGGRSGGDGDSKGGDAGRPSWLEQMESRGTAGSQAPSRNGPSAGAGARENAAGGRPAPRPAGPDRALTPAAERAHAAAPAHEPAGQAAAAHGPGPGAGPGAAPVAAPSPADETDRLVARLREEAREAGRADAQHGIPSPDAPGPTDSEMDLGDRCVAFFERWVSERRRATLAQITDAEERASDKLGRISLGLDRFQRLTNELIRLKARYSVRKEEVVEDLEQEGRKRPRGIPTKIYALALAFLGLVEFFANAPVFAALLPRDPLTERQIRVLTEMSEGWMAGAERTLAHLVFRPEATLLAAGIITFLCVLCHFFGGSLRELVMHKEKSDRRYTVQGRSALENAVPLVLTSVGIVLVLGVLYQARIDLGEVGQERYEQDMAQVEEYRREAGWLRVDGELLAANELTNRADDLQEAAVELREYSYGMARLSFPILLLNLTLVLCAVSAAYFHRRDARREHFNELPFEDERRQYIERAEGAATDTAKLLSDVVRDIRELKTLAAMGAVDGWRSLVHQLESVVTVYRVENGRARGVDPRSLAAFASSPRLDIPEPDPGQDLLTRSPEEYERERAELARRFDEVRARFNEEASATWTG